MEEEKEIDFYRIFEDEWIRVHMVQWQGNREYQEDRFSQYNTDEFSLLSVFDGHGGDKVSEFCAKEFSSFLVEKYLVPNKHNFLLSVDDAKKQWGEIFDEGYAAFDNLIYKSLPKEYHNQGSTASTLILYKPTSTLIHSYIGDTRMAWEILRSQGGGTQGATEDHDVSNKHEYERVNKNLSRHPDASNYIVCDRKSLLNVFRAFGDFHCKQGDGSKVIVKPQILQFDCLNCTKGTIFINASDGYWKELQGNPPFEELKRRLTKDMRQNLKELRSLFYKHNESGKEPEDNVSVVVTEWKGNQLTKKHERRYTAVLLEEFTTNLDLKRKELEMNDVGEI